MICNFMIFSESVGSGASLSAELTGQNRTVSRQVPQIQRFVGLFYPLMSALPDIIYPLKDKVSNLIRTPDNRKSKRGTLSPKLANFCRYLASLYKLHFELINVVL